MCGKFTAKRWWRMVTDYAVAAAGENTEAGGDDPAAYAVMGMLPVIVRDPTGHGRVIKPMRWGMAEGPSWKIPMPMHARSEKIEKTHPFKKPFETGQRGIVIFETFNEGEEVQNPKGVGTNTVQWIVDPQDGQPHGFAFVFETYQIAELAQPLLACAQVTVPANELIRRTIAYNQDDPRMPAILDPNDWATWLGETDAPLDQVKAVLKTVEGVTWKAERAPKPEKKPRR